MVSYPTNNHIKKKKNNVLLQILNNIELAILQES